MKEANEELFISFNKIRKELKELKERMANLDLEEYLDSMSLNSVGGCPTCCDCHIIQNDKIF